MESRAHSNKSLQLTQPELELVRVLSVVSRDCLQLHRAAVARSDQGRQGHEGTPNKFDAALRKIAGRAGACCAPAVRLLLDGFMEAARSPDGVPLVIESGAAALGLQPAEVWRWAFWVFDRRAHLGRREDRTAAATLFLDAVREGSRRGHFGTFRSVSSRIVGGVPPELRDLTDRWYR